MFGVLSQFVVGCFSNAVGYRSLQLWVTVGYICEFQLLSTAYSCELKLNTAVDYSCLLLWITADYSCGLQLAYYTLTVTKEHIKHATLLELHTSAEH